MAQAARRDARRQCSASRSRGAMGPMRRMGPDGHSWDPERNGRFPVRAPRRPDGWRAVGRPLHSRCSRPDARRNCSASRFGSPSRPFSPSRPWSRPPSEASDHRVTWPASEAPATDRRQSTRDASVVLHCNSRRNCSASRFGSPSRPFSPSRPWSRPPSEASDHRVTWPAPTAPACFTTPTARRTRDLHHASRPPHVQRFAFRVHPVHSVHSVHVTARRAKRASTV